MKIISRTMIDIGSRQRSEIEGRPLSELRDSILSLGLMHPIVTAAVGGRHQLVAGHRRLSAIDQIASENGFFHCDSKPILPGEVPIIEVGDLTEEMIFQAELDENIIRVGLSWQDRDRALAKLHELRRAAHPEQTYLATAQEIAERSDGPGASAPRTLRRTISRAEVVAKHLDDPTIKNARNSNEAFMAIMKREHAAAQAELYRRRMLARPDASDIIIRQGDALKDLTLLEEAQFHLILTDPPYGLDAHGADYRSKGDLHHTYEDTIENARELLKMILVEGWRITRPSANLLIFTDIMHWDYLQRLASQMGWEPWRWPVIWRKAESEGFAPWSRSGFIHVYDVIFWATKGQRGLNRPHPDIISAGKVGRTARVHAAEKPLSLLETLIQLTTNPGDWILDPCCGSGSTLLAAKRRARRALGLDIDQTCIDTALSRLSTAAAESEEDEGSKENELERAE